MIEIIGCRMTLTFEDFPEEEHWEIDADGEGYEISQQILAMRVGLA